MHSSFFVACATTPCMYCGWCGLTALLAAPIKVALLAVPATGGLHRVQPPYMLPAFAAVKPDMEATLWLTDIGLAPLRSLLDTCKQGVRRKQHWQPVVNVAR